MTIKIHSLLDGVRLRRRDTYHQFSTSEQFTGEYWVDGAKIYEKTFVGDFKNQVVGSAYNIPVTENIDRGWIDGQNTFFYVGADTRTYGLAGTTVSVNSSAPSMSENQLGVYFSKTNNRITIEIGKTWTANYYAVTLRYTKVGGG